MFEEKDSHEGPVRFLPMFPHAVQSSMDIEPPKRPLHLPPLATITPVGDIFRRTTTRTSDRVLTGGGEGTKASVTQGPAVRFAIVAFVQPPAVGVALTLANAKASERLQQLEEVSAVRFTQGES